MEQRAHASPSSTVGPAAGETVEKMRGDMKFVGLVTIIYGALTSLSIVGALIGIPLIIAGLRLRESADGYRSYARGDRGALARAFEKQRSYFFIQKILIIVGLVFMLLYIAAIVFAVIFMGASGVFDASGTGGAPY